MEIFALLATILGLGAFWVFVVPTVQAKLPASFTSNTWFNLATVGGLLLLSVFVVSFVLRMVKVRPVVAA